METSRCVSTFGNESRTVWATADQPVTAFEVNDFWQQASVTSAERPLPVEVEPPQ